MTCDNRPRLASLPLVLRALDNHRERLAWIADHAAGEGRAWAIHARDQLGAIALKLRTRPSVEAIREAESFVDALAGPIDTAVRVLALEMPPTYSIRQENQQ